jgi:hypothetical protein
VWDFDVEHLLSQFLLLQIPVNQRHGIWSRGSLWERVSEMCVTAAGRKSASKNIRLCSKKRPNFLNSSPTSTEGALRLLGAHSGRFWHQAVLQINPTNSLCTCSVQRM